MEQAGSGTVLKLSLNAFMFLLYGV
ncbi:hypothetical protein NC652_018123 [Populus alba x Populus x berolinensis]|nr:hypothetical protein NC652_018123 [Populus alba x Populus x berolinensis]